MECKEEITVYYDGHCKLCSRETAHYKAQMGAKHILFVDICSEQFDAEAEGLDPRLVHKIMHVRRTKAVLELDYSCFAAVRPLLPRYAKTNECQESPYCEVKNA